MLFEAVKYAGNGVQLTSGAASQSVAIPQTANGRTARYVAVQTVNQGYAYVRFGATAAVAATAQDFPVSANELRIFDVAGQSFMAYLQETPGAKLNLCPIEY